MISEKTTSYILRLCPIHVSNFPPTVWGSYCIWYVTPYHLFLGYRSFCFIRNGFPHTVIQEGKWHSQKTMPITKIHVVGCSDISHGAISVSFVADVVFVYFFKQKFSQKVRQWSIWPHDIIQLRQGFLSRERLETYYEISNQCQPACQRKSRTFLPFPKTYSYPKIYHIFNFYFINVLDPYFKN